MLLLVIPIFLKKYL